MSFAFAAKLAAEWYLFTSFSSLRQRIRGGGGQGGRVGKRGQRRKRLMRRDTSAHWCWVTQQRHPSYISWVCAFHHGRAWTHLSPSSDGRTCRVCVWSCMCVFACAWVQRSIMWPYHYIQNAACTCLIWEECPYFLIHLWHLDRLSPPFFSFFPPALIRFVPDVDCMCQPRLCKPLVLIGRSVSLSFTICSGLYV